MASFQSIPRFLLPRGPLPLRPRPYSLLPVASIRHASATAGPPRRNKQPVIPQPDKYRPPSHGRRTPRSETQQKSYGPNLTAEDRERMRTKKYPNMMSPEGTFSHWFLHSHLTHTFITMSILITLAGAAWYMDFMSKTIYGDLIPDKKEFLRHPWQSSNRFIEVYKMHMEHTSEVCTQQRLKKAEDVEKRKIYRLERIREAEERGEEYQDDPRYYVDEQGVRRRRVKRWLGIWE